MCSVEVREFKNGFLELHSFVCTSGAYIMNFYLLDHLVKDLDRF